MTLATRNLWLGIGAVLLLTLAAAAVTVHQADRRARAAALAQLRLAVPLERELEANRLAELQLRADSLAQDPAFVDYVAQSLIPVPQLGGAIDKASISDLLKERRNGYDVAMVLDTQGAPIAASGVLLRDRAGIQADPLVAQAISRLQSRQGIWVDHGQLLWVAVSPLLRGGALQGALLVATRIDDAFAVTIGRIARADIALLATPAAGVARLPSTGLADWTAQALSTQLPQLLRVTERSGKALELTDGEHRVAAWVAPMQTSGGQAALVAIDADDDGDSDLAGAGASLMGVAGLGLCGLLLVLWQWWRTWLPLQRMLGVVELARHGDVHLTINVEGSVIVRRLRDGINALLHRAP
jgi:hypothetical protein